MTTSIDAVRLKPDDAPARVRRVLSRDPFAAAYMLGDLDPIYAPYCEWWVASEGAPAPDSDVSVLQVYTGLSAPVVITHGSAAGIAAILAGHVDDLPQRAHVHMAPDHLAILDQHFTLERLRPMVRMGMRAGGMATPELPAQVGYRPVETLSHRDTGDIMELSHHYPDSFFEPHQLSTGHYYGVRAEDGRLVAVAGVHIVSRTDRLAALGNIVTHPEHRGRGLSTVVTAHLCRSLAAEGIEMFALNVERKNSSAMRVYEKLGFVDHCTYVEAFLSRTLADKIKAGA